MSPFPSSKLPGIDPEPPSYRVRIQVGFYGCPSGFPQLPSYGILQIRFLYIPMWLLPASKLLGITRLDSQVFLWPPRCFFPASINAQDRFSSHGCPDGFSQPLASRRIDELVIKGFSGDVTQMWSNLRPLSDVLQSRAL